MKILAPLLSLLVCLGSAIGQGITRNSVTTNAWPKVFPAANDVLLWDGVNNRWTNGTASTTATNAISDINGSSSNHQFIVIWSAAETSNTFGIQTAQGAAGGTNFFHFPVADLTHSGVLTSNDWRIFAGLQFTNADPSQFSVANRTLYFISGAMATNLNANGITNRGFTLLQGNTIAATNGWLQFGDPVNTQQITNYDNTWFYGSAFVQPSRIFQFWNSSIALITNSTLLVGGSDLTTNTIRFNSQGYIADSVTDASEDLRYRLGSTTIGWHSNDVVRMRDLTNITVNLLTNLTVNPNQLVSAGQPLTIIAGAKQTNLTSYGWETFNGPFTNSSTFVFSSPGGFFDIVDALDFFTFFNGIKVTNSLGLFKMPQTNRVLFLDGSNHVTNVTSQAASTDLVYADGSAHPLISGYSLTNTVTYGNTVTFPGVLPIPRVLKLDGDGILSSVVSAAPSSDFVHADGSVGSAGAPNMNTNTVLVGSQPTISLWSGTGVKVYATNNGAASRIDYTFDGAVSLPTNQNQFVSLAGDNTLNIKNGALLTNVIERGITEPNLTVSRVVMVNPSGNLTNVVGTASDFLKVDGSSSAGTSLAAGNTADIQFNQGNSLAGTNRFTYVRNATDGDALGIMVAKVAGNTTPGIKISDTGSTFDLYLHPRGLTTTNGSLIAKAGTLSWVLDSTTGSWGPNGTDVSQDLGGVTTHVRTNWSGTLDVSNIVQRGFKMEIPQKLSTNGAAIFSSVVTNLIADGGLGNVFTNFNISFGGITNVYATNLQDHQEIKLLVFVAPGSSVVFPQFTATNFLSGMVEAPDTNVVSEIKIWRTGNFTNLSVKTREYTLTNGTSVTFTTNYVAGAIAINSSAGGGGSGIIQIQTNNAIIGNQTNINFFGDNMTLSATNNSASNKVDLLISSVVRQISISGSTASQQIDFSLGNRYVVTNMLNVNQTYNLTNFADGRPMFLEVPANNLGTNFDITVFVAAGSSSTNIKWLSNTNPIGNITAQSNATYIFSFATDVTPLATNIIAAWTTTTGNPIRNNPLLAAAGSSPTNAFVGGVVYKNVFGTALTNLNATIATYTNLAAWNTPAHMLTNNNDSVILTWRGLVLAGTNAWKLVYGSQTILDTGSFTNRDGGWEAGMEITRTGNTNQHVDAWIRYQQFFVSPSTNFLSGWQTNWDTWQTNGIAISNMLQVASNRAGSVSNNYLKVVYEPGLR